MKNLGGYLVGGLLLFAAYRFSKFSNTGEAILDEDTNTGGNDTDTNTETENDNAEAIDSLNEQIDELQEDIITITGDLEESDSNIGINTEFLAELDASKQDAGDFLTASDLETYEESIDTLTESVGTFQGSLDTFATKQQVDGLGTTIGGFQGSLDTFANKQQTISDNLDTISEDLDGFDMGTITELDNRITQNNDQDAMNQIAQNSLNTKITNVNNQLSGYVNNTNNSIGLLGSRLTTAESGIGEFTNLLSTKANTSDLDSYLTQADYNMDTLNNNFVKRTEFDDFGQDFENQLNELGNYVNDALGSTPVPITNDSSKNFNGGFQDSW